MSLDLWLVEWQVLIPKEGKVLSEYSILPPTLMHAHMYFPPSFFPFFLEVVEPRAVCWIVVDN